MNLKKIKMNKLVVKQVSIVLLMLWSVCASAQGINFSGKWIRNDSLSDAGELSLNSIPVEIIVVHNGSQIEINRISKNANGEIINYTERINLGGSPASSVVKPNMNKNSTMDWSVDHMFLNATASYTDDQGGSIQKKKETWSLINNGKSLQIKSIMEFDGQSVPMTQMYDKR